VVAKPIRSSAALFLLGLATGLVLPSAWALLQREAHAQEGKMPFASSIEQRQQSVEELRKLNALMQKQLDVLTSGRVRVVVINEPSDGGRR
jgi:hypothetical protein